MVLIAMGLIPSAIGCWLLALGSWLSAIGFREMTLLADF
jgi:hypothetical protein